MMADTTVLSWINAEVERALTLVQESIAKFSAAPENEAALKPCPEHLHQVSGALRMVGLAGATRVCEAIENTFNGMGGARPTPAAIGVIDRAVVALKNFIGELARGHADVPLRLFPVYRDICGLLGKTAVSEKDLFFPDLNLSAPAHASPRTVPQEERTAFLQAERARFQRGLLAWLRGAPVGLRDMRQTVDALHQAATDLPEPRALWWAAGALVDSLKSDAGDDPQWLASAKVVCNRIDFHIRDLGAGTAKNGDALLREVLYSLARREAATPCIREVKQLYQLETLFPRPERSVPVLELDAERLEASLFDMHSRLEALKRSWEQYGAGERDQARVFRERVADFKLRTRDLGNAHLIKLLDAIALAAAKLPDPYSPDRQAMVIEMASAFLLVEHVIDHFSNPSDDLELQIVIMGNWLLDAANGKSNGEPPPGLRTDLTERIGALQLRAQVAKEILANLQHVEQVIDAFARDPGKRPTLAGLQPYLRQMHGALSVLGFPGAAQAVSICEGLVKAQASTDASAEDVDWIAEALSSVGFFLEPCRHGREPGEEAIALFFRRYEKRNQPRTPDSTLRIEFPSTGATAAPPPPARAGVDAELLQVFLDEADEVLQTIARLVPECREKPHDQEALTTVRRAFHTLKGSGRMVGLMDLGEAAWRVEQVLNIWLEQKRPVNAPLLELVEAASASFAGWIERLRGPGLDGLVDDSTIVELAARAKADPSDVSAAGMVTIGTVSIPRGLYSIYTNEAAEHVKVLKAECVKWRQAMPAEASQDFMRAAHTLASTSRTAGFIPLAELAGALEQWTQFAKETVDAADANTVQDAVAELGKMVDAVSKSDAPAIEGAPRAALPVLLTRLQAARLAHRPAPAPQPRGGRDKRSMRDDLDGQLLPVFIEEAQQLVPAIGADLREWKANPSDAQISQSLRRSLHTLKGSARMAGAIRLGELCHLMESRIESALESGALTPELFQELEERMDRLSADVERIGAPLAAAPVAAEAKAEAPLPSPAAMLRVNADTLDHLINEAGEIAIARTRVEAEVRAMRQSLADLAESVARLRNQLREVELQADSQMQSRLSVLDEKKSEFDPLEFDRYTRLQELTRLMAESLNDVLSTQQGLHKYIGDTDAALAEQARISREVQQDLMYVRAVPFATLSERLYRLVRQTARELGKKAELEISGAEVELDRGVLERIAAPLEHILRNALVHGIEDAATRLAAGKPESGRIIIALRQESNELALAVSDDGAGLNLDALRLKAAGMGLLPSGREPTEGELAQLVFATGVSTADTVTELAGRGVGMDVVRNDISSIGGRVEIATAPGSGTTFTSYLPLTLAVSQSVLVRAGENVLALATGMVEQVLRIKAEALAEHFEAKAVEFQGRSYPLHSMRALLGKAPAAELLPYNSVLLLRSGLQRIAIHVDELIGNQEIVVKSIGVQLARVPGVSGATVLPDGRIALIMNPVQLAQRQAAAPGMPHAVHTPAARTAAAAVVMVVDDSLTVRKVTSRLLEREGYRVVTAKDGVDALEQMAESLPAVMLVDIEMPRMDGFDLARHVRGDVRTRDLPIIFISSRTAEKHRNQAAQLGVNAFLGKPYPEAELLALVAKYSAA
ncbi:MAG TPA: hybrid sensor histidine kinase/response regulator [Burkholderiales bacterium]|nr:hybrid sensor histidine kinase/response regulator [Burkholderiales bacterium]